MRFYSITASLCAVFGFIGLVTRAGLEQKAVFKVEITTKAGRVLDRGDLYGLVGIEQTLVARITPALEGGEYEWTVGAPVLRSYEHDIQRADKHLPIPLGAKYRNAGQLSFFWTKPQDGVEVSVRVRKGADQQTAKVAFNVRVPRDANRDIYSYADNDPLRNPNGLAATYAITRSHRFWHLGQKMSNGEMPVFPTMHDPVEKTVWGDVGYRNDPARMFGLDYNGTALLGWHGAMLDAHRAWRRTFHVPDLDTAPPPGGLPLPGYLKRVPDEKSADQSRLYGYVRAGEFQNMDQLGRDAVHPWHNRGHTGIAKVNGEPLMDDHSVSPPARNDLFFRWHTVVEEGRRVLGPDKATVTTVFPAEGATVSECAELFVAFDRKVSANAPAANVVQLAAGKLTVNGKPATTVADVGGDRLTCIVYRITGFPAITDGAVKVELTGTAGYKGTAWTFTAKKGAKPSAVAAVPAEFMRDATKAFQAAQFRHRKEDIDRSLALLTPADADDIWLGYMFDFYPMPPDEGVPILVKLLDHPSHHVRAHAAQLLQYRYGPKAVAAIPKLVELLNGKGERPWWVREWAARALAEIGPNSPAVVAALSASIKNKEASEPVNRGSIEALGRIGPGARDVLPLLRGYLASSDPETQFAAYRAVGRIVNAPLPSVDDLKKLTVVDQGAADGGYATFLAIQEAGSKADFAIPALLKTFRPGSPVSVNGAVLETIGKIGSGHAVVFQLLLDTVPARWGTPGDPPAEKFLLDLACDALARLSPTDPQAVPVLVKALGHSDIKVRHQAAIALRKFRSQAKPAVPALVDLLKQADSKVEPHIVGAYLDVLRAIGADANAAAGTLVELLSERSKLYAGQEKFYAHYLQAYLLVTLADIGVPEGAKPYILDFLNNSDKTTAHGYAASARAAGSLGDRMPEAIPGLLRPLRPGFADFVMSFERFAIALGPEDSSCRLESLRALAKMGPKAAKAMPLIVPLVKETPERGLAVPPWSEEAVKTLRAIRGKE